MSGEEFDLRTLIRPDLLELPGYVPITPTDVLAERYGIARKDVIKLDGNENPYGPSPRAFAAIAARVWDGLAGAKVAAPRIVMD